MDSEAQPSRGGPVLAERVAADEAGYTRPFVRDPGRALNIGLLGMGVVGTGLIQALHAKTALLQPRVGCPVRVKSVLVRDLDKPRGFQVARGLLTTRPEDVLNDPEVDIVVEVMGGEHPALEYILAAIEVGKHVVTANKEVVARHGREILARAHHHGVQVRFEASVAGGVPIVAPLLRDLAANEITSIRGIVNGTTNYILSRMAQQGLECGEALAEAQRLGYAEADPAKDVGGMDAACKLSILCALVFGVWTKDLEMHRQGINGLARRDLECARELGYAVKLMASAKKVGGVVYSGVYPAFVPEGSAIAQVDGVLNAVEVETDLAGPLLFTGQGAGPSPTASALIADIMDVALGTKLSTKAMRGALHGEAAKVGRMADLEAEHYLRLVVADRPQRLTEVRRRLSDHGVESSFAMFRELPQSDSKVEVVVMTRRAKLASVQQALSAMQKAGAVLEVGNVCRVEEAR
ncbi:MAG: homoserine dehydrogenase [SAR202 cluster bacterium]|nr:homoserine dehydrogenase [SAR202 cluster bacterium]